MSHIGARMQVGHFRVTMVAKAFCPYTSSLNIVRKVVNFPMKTQFSAFYRYMLQLPALQDYGSSNQLAMDGMSFGRLQVLFPFQRCALSGKQLSLTAAGVLWRRSDVTSAHPPFICVVFQHRLVRYRATIAAGRDHTHHGGRCGDVERWQPHSEACNLCLSLNRGGRLLV